MIDRNGRLDNAITQTRELADDLRERADRIDQQRTRLQAVRDVVSGTPVEGFTDHPMAIASVLASTAREVADIVSHTQSHTGYLAYMLAMGAAEIAAQQPQEA